MFASNEPGFLNYLVGVVILLLVSGYWVARIRMMWRDPAAHAELVKGEREERNKKLGMVGGIVGHFLKR